MRIGAIIQARMASMRLPGKVLLPVAGRPVLQCLLERVARSTGIDEAIIATSVERDDDAIALFCRTRRVPCVRSPLENVVARLQMAAERHGLDAFIRPCADSPLLDPALVSRAVGEFRAREVAAIVQSPRPRESHMMFLWQLVDLELWLRELDSAARRPQPAVESVAGQLTAHN